MPQTGTDELVEALPSNSKISKKVGPIRQGRERKELLRAVPVVERPQPKSQIGRAVVKKKTLAQSIAKTLLADETKNVALYVLYDVLIPAVKTTVTEMVSSGIEMLIYGDSRPQGRGRDRGRASNTNYGSIFEKDARSTRRAEPRRLGRANNFNLDEIFFANGKEADDILTELSDSLEQYEAVTVAEFYALAGVEGATWAHERWGWTSLRKAYCTHTRNGWAIVFPEPIELE